jgi:6-phosphogluconolactonase/glucosamine-6-phosphate isomerase/deaminase
MRDEIQELIEREKHKGAKIVVVSGGGSSVRSTLEKMGLAGIKVDSVIFDEYPFGPAHSEAYSELHKFGEELKEVEPVQFYQNRADRRRDERRKKHDNRNRNRNNRFNT